MNNRAIAANIVSSVICHRRSLTDVLSTELLKKPDTQGNSLIKELCYGSIRWYGQLEAIANQLLISPMDKKNSDIFCLLITGLYQIIHLNVPDYAAVSETVNAAKSLKKPWASGLINKTLRMFIKSPEQFITSSNAELSIKTSHPQWLIDSIKHDWPKNYLDIIEQNNSKAPMFVRVNEYVISKKNYLKKLDTAGIETKDYISPSNAICLLQPLPIEKLPGFETGEVYIQDISGQHGAYLLDLQLELFMSLEELTI